VQFGTALKANRQKEVERKQLGEWLRNLKARAEQTGEDSQKKEKNGRSKDVGKDQGKIHGSGSLSYLEKTGREGD
jgi:hypothetical protein